jgi:hypothetical protein
MRPSRDFVRRQAQLVVLCCFLVLPRVAAADGNVDYNAYYRYPLSLGIESQYLIPFRSYAPLGVVVPYTVVDVSANIRLPLPPLPVLQPTLRLGATFFDRSDTPLPDAMDHTDLYASAGLTTSWRFSKLLELGVEVLGGYDYSLYPNLSPGKTLGNGNLIVDAGLKLTISPVFNMSLELHPAVRYLRSLSSLSGFDGLTFAVGALANVRLGTDPDAGKGTIRAIQFDQLSVPAAFSAMQSWYATHPLGSVVIKNIEKETLEDLEVSFLQTGYMDAATPAGKIARLAPGESKKIDLFAAYNEEVFATVGVTPLNGEIVAVYRYQGKAVEQRQVVTYDLYDKSAIVWDDDRKVAAFITQSDPVVRDLASLVRQSCKDQVLRDVSPSLQTAMEVYGGLAIMGCLYQADPSAPFARMQASRVAVDSVSLARSTLGRLTGDCDDLTVLFCSLLESAGVETAFLTVPGHIYAAVNTKVKAANFRKVHPDHTLTITLKDEVWVPVEITLMGKRDFMEAWRTGMEEWSTWEKDTTVRGFYPVGDSQQLYRPVALKEAAPTFASPDGRAVGDSFRDALERLTDELLAPYIDQANSKSATAADLNKLGVRYAQYARYAKAESSFLQALRLDSGYLAASANLGSLYFGRKDYARALSSFTGALQLGGGALQGSEYARLLINVSRTYYQLEKYAEARDYFSRAQEASPDVAKEYAYLGAEAAAGARAAEAQDEESRILFLGE